MASTSDGQSGQPNKCTSRTVTVSEREDEQSEEDKKDEDDMNWFSSGDGRVVEGEENDIPIRSREQAVAVAELDDLQLQRGVLFPSSLFSLLVAIP